MKTVHVIVLLSLGFLGMLCAGCPHPPPTPHPPDAHMDAASPPTALAPTCPAETTETPEDVCTALFTIDGHACVRCRGGEGCVDKSVEIYCVRGTCFDDPACHRVADHNFGSSAARHRIQHGKSP